MPELRSRNSQARNAASPPVTAASAENFARKEAPQAVDQLQNRVKLLEARIAEIELLATGSVANRAPPDTIIRSSNEHLQEDALQQDDNHHDNHHQEPRVEQASQEEQTRGDSYQPNYSRQPSIDDTRMEDAPSQKQSTTPKTALFRLKNRRRVPVGSQEIRRRKLFPANRRVPERVQYLYQLSGTHFTKQWVPGVEIAGVAVPEADDLWRERRVWRGR